MNIFKAMAVRSVEEATRAIPVIDFGPAFRGETSLITGCAYDALIGDHRLYRSSEFQVDAKDGGGCIALVGLR